MARRSRTTGAPRRPASTSSRARTPPPRQAPKAPERQAASAAPASRPAAAKPNAPPPAPAAAAAPPPAAAPAQSGGMMSNMMANVASTAVGVTAGRALDRALFGGGSSEAGPPADAQEYQEATGPTVSYPQADGYPSAEVCSFELSEFQNCLQSGQNAEGCKWNYDILLQCQKAAAENRQY